MKGKARIYFFWSVFMLALVSSVFITFQVTKISVPFLDRWSAPAVANLDNTWIFNLFRWITELGSGTFLVPFSIVMAFVLWRFSKDWIAALMVAFGVLFGYLANFWVKSLVQRERPRILVHAEGEGFSFPSGHAMVSLITYGLLAYFLMKYVKSKQAALLVNLIAIILILLIGLSRYAIRVHYLTDVLGGYAFGFIFIVIWISLYELFIRMQESKHKPPSS